MYKIYNNADGINLIFTGNETEFIQKVKKIAIENGDEFKVIVTVNEAIHYLCSYCTDLYYQKIDTVDASEVIKMIAERLSESDGEYIEEIANEVLNQNAKYIGDSLFEVSNL